MSHAVTTNPQIRDKATMNVFPNIVFLLAAIASALLIVIALKLRMPKLNKMWVSIILGATAYSIIFIANEAAPSIKGKPFVHAVESGDARLVKKLLTENPLLAQSATTFSSDTGLQLAARAGNSEMVVLLLDAGANVNTRNRSGLGPLHEAAFTGNARIAEILLKAGAYADSAGGKFNGTPLHVAASMGHEDVVQVLLKNGALARLITRTGDTPLQLAIKKNHSNIVAILSNQSLTNR
jgi:ankyrin repeat protein